MSVNAVSSSYQNQTKAPAAAVGTKQGKTDGNAEINKLNAEIKQTESELKKTAKEVQKAVGDSAGGSSEQVQLLQNKMQMQQQAISMKQIKIKKIESPSKSTAEQAEGNMSVRAKVDQYIAGEDTSSKPDNVYRLEEKDGKRTIIFNRPKS